VPEGSQGERSMQFARFTGFTGGLRGRFRLACAALAITAAAGPALAADPPATLATLLDRAQIEDMLVDYYSHLGSGGGSFGAFYVEDGVLDVNGIVAQGQKGIQDLYEKIAAGTPPRPGTFRMMLSNLKIVVNGSTATADVLWTGVNSADVKAPPQFVEQGREHDELVKRDGHWRFKHRVITSDGGLPAMFEKTYQKR
jgi:SnoaL-like domain